jgi:beta-glucosidase
MHKRKESIPMTSSDYLIKPHVEERVMKLLAQMSLDEKIGQLNQYFARGNFDPQVLRAGRAGSVMNATGALTGQSSSASTSAEVCNYLQKLSLESRLKIPQLFGRDVIHGYRTVFPIPLAQAAAWNPDLVMQAARVAAREATADGIKWTFAPMIDIARDPRWGRVAEGSGEDPWLGSQIATALVRGFQGDDFSAPDRLVACAKHFVGYGSAEGGRDYDSGEISEPTLQDVYLPPYRAVVDAGVGTLMSAFLDLNGVPVTSNRHLITDLLRGKWGFQGFVVSDWESVSELVHHGVAADGADAARLALHAGVDMDMVSEVYLNTLAASVQANQISIEEIDAAVCRILRIKFLAGLFEDPFTDPDRAAREQLTPEARQLARQLARASMVLLKNSGDLLPFRDHYKKILVAGPLVHAGEELFGTWTPDGRRQDVTILSEALQQAAPSGVQLHFAVHNDRILNEAQAMDAVVLVLGEHPRRSGENANVAHLELPPGQAELVAAVADLGKPVVLVVLAGRPLAISRQVSQADAVLFAWHPGIEGGAALGDLLFGKAAPSGRLPVSFPRATGQVPVYYNHKNSGRPVGSSFFTSRYVDLPSTPLFPFGYGLTYTRFKYANIELSSPILRDSIHISAEVTNAGDQAGDELVQLYVRDLIGSLTRPVRELKGCQHLVLQPGETRRVTFTLRASDLGFTRADGTYGSEAGGYQVWIAPDSVTGLQETFSLVT